MSGSMVSKITPYLNLFENDRGSKDRFVPNDNSMSPQDSLGNALMLAKNEKFILNRFSNSIFPRVGTFYNLSEYCLNLNCN